MPVNGSFPILRPYQNEMVDALLQHALDRTIDYYPVGVLPTGTGKTIVAASIIRNFSDLNLPSLIVAPSVILLKQHQKTLADFVHADKFRLLQPHREMPGIAVRSAYDPKGVEPSQLLRCTV